MINSQSMAATAAGFALLLPLSAHAQIKKSGNAYTLRMKYTPGTVRKYSIVTTITGMSAAQAGVQGPLKITGTLEQKVLSVAGKVGKLEIKTSALQMANGTAIGEPKTVTTNVDEFGNAADEQGNQGYGVHFPKEAIKVGGTWSQATDIPGTVGGASKATTTYKFNGIKRVGKQSVADISFNIQPAGMLKGGSGHSYLNPADGSLAGLSLKINIANPQGGADLMTNVSVQPIK